MPPSANYVISAGPHGCPSAEPRGSIQGHDRRAPASTRRWPPSNSAAGRSRASGQDLAPGAWPHLMQACEEARALLGGRTLWSINSTALGGGVAEMQRTLWPYWRDAGIDARWLVLSGSPTTSSASRSACTTCCTARGASARTGRPRALRPCRASGRRRGRRARRPRRRGRAAGSPDRCPGRSAATRRRERRVALPRRGRHDERARRGGVAASSCPTSRRLTPSSSRVVRSSPTPSRRERVMLLSPAIDPRSEKNRPLVPGAARALLDRWNLAPVAPEDRLVARARALGPAEGPHRDPPRVCRSRRGPARLPRPGGPGRWPRRRRPGGRSSPCRRERSSGAASRRTGRERVQVAALPMPDLDENALIVNALQREAAVVVKKSLQEGFGLGVTEGMWKAKPVVATRVGGHQDQIEHGRSGLLVDDPADLPAFAAAVDRAARRSGARPRARRCGPRAGPRPLPRRPALRQLD